MKQFGAKHSQMLFTSLAGKCDVDKNLTSDMTHSFVWYYTLTGNPSLCDSFLRDSKWKRVYTQVNASRFCCVTWLIHTCGKTNSYVWHCSCNLHCSLEFLIKGHTTSWASFQMTWDNDFLLCGKFKRTHCLNKLILNVFVERILGSRLHFMKHRSTWHIFHHTFVLRLLHFASSKPLGSWKSTREIWCMDSETCMHRIRFKKTLEFISEIHHIHVCCESLKFEVQLSFPIFISAKFWIH